MTPVPGFPDYGVNEQGQVMRLTSAPGTRAGKILKQCPNGRGYLYVNIGKGKKRLWRSVHSLVAEVFIGPCPAGMTIDHKNECKTDNRVSNLEYVSNAENNKRAYDRGRPRPYSKKKKEQQIGH